jgi:hypothetical protein
MWQNYDAYMAIETLQNWKMLQEILRKETYNRRRQQRLRYRRKIVRILKRHIWNSELSKINMKYPDCGTNGRTDTKLAHFKTKSLKDCFLDLKNEMALPRFNRSICYVCLELCFQSDLKRLELTSDNISEFHNLASTAHKQKSGSKHFPTRRSTVHNRNYHIHELLRIGDKEYLECCTYCSRHLARNTTLPKFSIPNYVFPEPVPECLKKLGIAELLMVSRIFPRCIIYTLSQNNKTNHRFLKGKLSVKN